MSISVLSRAGSLDVNTRPFAHLVYDHAMESSLYEKLTRDFPPPERFTRGMAELNSNQAVRIPAGAIISNPEFSPEWREFFWYHSSRDFWNDILRLMGDHLREAHPHLEQAVGKRFEDWTVAMRGTDNAADVILDALLVVNTPVTRMGSVRPAHVDSEDEIWAGLLYMRPDSDPTPGGDLALYHFKGSPAFGGHYAPLSAVVEDKVVKYAANRFVSFINSERSIHGVTPRPPTPHFRRYINFIATLPFKAFKLPKMSSIGQFKFWMERRNTKSRGVVAKLT